MIGTSITLAAVSVVLGLVLAAGVALLASTVPRIGAPSLSSRIAPYVRDVTDPLGIAPPVRAWGRDLRDVLAALRDGTAARIGGSEDLVRRLAQAGERIDPATFRARQLGWSVVGLAVGGTGTLVLALTGRMSVPAALIPVAGGLMAALCCDMLLTRRGRRRRNRIDEELPAVLEFLALCLSAGEGIYDAIRRVSELGSGELTGELRATVVEVGTGTPLADALLGLAGRLRTPALTRAVDHLVVALDRGAPLAQVLQDQAVDAREDARRGLIESAGRKEIGMLLPLVFLILPLSVLFATYPGVHLLRTGLA